MDLKSIIRDVPDFPKPGIIFKDITPLLKNPKALEGTVSLLCKSAEGFEITSVAGIESRGFIFGAAAAIELGVGFVPIRKPGKLPAETISDIVEMHKDALESGERVFLIDDLLATGGTVQAATKLIEKTGAEVSKIAFVIELGFLNGREKIQGYDITSLITF